MSESMRKEFEAWFYEIESFSIRGEQFDGPMSAAWAGWQAALATQPQAPQGGDDSLKVGDLVAIIVGDDPYYRSGTTARLSGVDDDGCWWACFRNCGNEEGSFDDFHDGIWCVGQPSDFSKKLAPTETPEAGK